MCEETVGHRMTCSVVSVAQTNLQHEVCSYTQPVMSHACAASLQRDPYGDNREVEEE